MTTTPKMAASMSHITRFRCQTVFLRTTAQKEKSAVFVNGSHRLLAIRNKSSTNEVSSLQYCMNLVKKCDYENYLCTLLYPKSYRTSAFTLRALYIELAQIQDVTTDNMRAIIRLQFWKDSIDYAFKGNPPQTPIATLLAEAAEKHKLSKIWLTRILEAREKQINTKVVRTIQDVEDVGENTASALSYLLLETAGVKNVHADHAASHIGRCQALVTLLRATAFHASRHKVYIPMELLVKHKVSQEQVIRGRDDQGVKDVMYDIASRAHQQLETARDFQKDVPSAAMPVLLNAFICDQYLKQLQLADFNVFDKRLFGRNPKLPWLLWKQRYLKRTY